MPAALPWTWQNTGPASSIALRRACLNVWPKRTQGAVDHSEFVGWSIQRTAESTTQRVAEEKSIYNITQRADGPIENKKNSPWLPHRSSEISGKATRDDLEHRQEAMKLFDRESFDVA